MTEQKIRAVIALLARTLDVPEDDLGPESCMDSTPLWDSIEHMNVCLAFERRFGRTLDMDAITTATSVRKLAQLVP